MQVAEEVVAEVTRHGTLPKKTELAEGVSTLKPLPVMVTGTPPAIEEL